MILLLVFEKYVVMIFTYHQNISKVILDSIPIVSIICITMFIEGTGQGIIKAMGYQTIASIILCICMWVIALPCTLLFGFYFKIGLKGLWLGYLVGNILIAISYSAIILKADWMKITEDALDRFRNE